MRLVLQGKSITESHLAHIHQILGTNAQFMQIAEFAYYLPVHTTEIKAVQLFCMEQKIDCALVPDAQRLSHFGLCVMDMDSTLIAIECIDEIADMMQLKPQISAITESAMRGDIDFATSLKERVNLLKGLRESALQRVIDERLTLNPGAQQWVTACKANNIKTMVVSGGFTFFTDHVKQLLGLDYAVANSLEIIDGKLTGNILGKIVDAESKSQELIKLRDLLKLEPDQTIAIGDGANDLKMMKAAAVSIAYHAKPIVQSQAAYTLNYSGLDAVTNLFTA